MTIARSGALSPLPVATRPLAEINTGLDELKAGRIKGRVVVRP
jgi:D-arabinose 1-dehydrogenase-like Zn-dependent alcohol dehydrogenase